MSGTEGENGWRLYESLPKKRFTKQTSQAQDKVKEKILKALLGVPLWASSPPVVAWKMYRPSQIDGVGLVSFPIPPIVAQALVRVCSVSPFGRKEETVFDKKVRDTWHLEPSKVHFRDDGLKELIEHTVKSAAYDLGIRKAEVSLYKLLVYETGGHFAPHRDTEKEAGMIASLVVLLPSEYEGGKLVVQHGKDTVEFDFAKYGHQNMSYMAFYSDCLHTVEPLKSGYRVALVYNLCTKEEPRPRAVSVSEPLAKALSKWFAFKDAGRIFIPLDHLYSPSQQTLFKNRDRAIVHALAAAVVDKQLPVSACTGTYEHLEAGFHSDDDTRGYLRFEPGAILFGAAPVSGWGRKDIAQCEVIEKDYFQDAIPDRFSEETHTGNDGQPFEKQ